MRLQHSIASRAITSFQVAAQLFKRGAAKIRVHNFFFFNAKQNRLASMFIVSLCVRFFFFSRFALSTCYLFKALRVRRYVYSLKYANTADNDRFFDSARNGFRVASREPRRCTRRQFYFWRKQSVEQQPTFCGQLSELQMAFCVSTRQK